MGRACIVERRTFMTSMLGTTLFAAAGFSSGAEGQSPTAEPSSPELFVWRQYLLRTGTQPRRLADYLQNAAIPALNRIGHKPVGVFEVVTGLPTPTVFVLTPCSSIESVVTMEGALDKDDAFASAAAAYVDASPADPAYV